MAASFRLSLSQRLVVYCVVFFLLGVFFWLLMIRMPLRSYDGPWTPLSANEESVREALETHVRVLADEIGERHIFAYRNYMAAADYIETSFRESGYDVKRQELTTHGQTSFNLEVEIRGAGRPDEIVVVGAHYDSVAGSPAANDNGSGVAALLHLARAFAETRPERTLRFVAFANEEPPFFQTAAMRSLVYAEEAARRGDAITGMVSLETIGYFTDAPGSQNYPFPLSFFYPSKGNFLAFVGNFGSRRLVRDAIRVFRETTEFPSEGAALPSVIPGVGWSDHWSFWQHGFPAIMVTDTAPYRYPYYHSPDDTLDKLTFERMARAVAGLEAVVHGLANP